VVLTVVLAPFAFAAAASAYGAFAAGRMEEAVLAAARAGGHRVEQGGSDAAVDADLDAVAQREGVRLRVVDGGGAVRRDVDHEPATSLRDRIGDLFFGREGAPTLRMWEDVAPPLPARPEIDRARRGEAPAACDVVLGGRLAVCHAAIGAGDGVVVVAEKSTPRAIRALWDSRGALLKLTLYVLLAGLGLAAWLARRIVRPIERLRDEVLARTASPLSGDPVHAGGADEIGELAASFNALLAAIADRSRQNQAFMADLVHELKSPVAAVRAAADALGEGGPVEGARAARLQRALLASSGRLDALVTEFLDLARAEAGLPNEAREPVDLHAMVRGSIDATRSDERHAGVRFDLDAAPATVPGVAGRLERAVGNVLENAASFAGSGGTVRAIVRVDGEACVIEVSDTGPGIDAEKIGRIFDRFFTDRRDGRGTGLGLALAKAIVEAHGGSIAAASPEGSGAVFTIRLPRSG
jgi:two-component system sensor histidine kinase ChvG